MNRLKWLIINGISSAVFAVGCVFVWLYTTLFKGEIDMTKSNPNVPVNQPIGHNTYAYPIESQAWESGGHIGRMLVGAEPRDNAALINHCYTVVGYGLSLGFPVETVVFGASATDIEDEAKTFFGGAAQAQATSVGFDWKSALRIALQLLLQLLSQPTP